MRDTYARHHFINDEQYSRDEPINAPLQTPFSQKHWDMSGRNMTEIRINLTRIDTNNAARRVDDQAGKQDKKAEENDERPRLRRTLMPSRRVLERRERQRALNERIRDTYFDRINGNFFPMEQVEE